MAYTYIEGNQAHTSGPNGTITRIVLHATVSPCVTGGARGNASYFQSAGAGGLAHFIVDPGEIVQCCREDVCCWHAPPNQGSIGIELCDPQTGDPSRWADGPHEAMLRLTAQLVADLAQRHGVPLTYIDRNALLAGAHGITTHHEVSQAWHQSDHTDPGPGFPIAHLLSLIGNPTSLQETAMSLLYVLPDGKTVFVADSQTKRHVTSPAEEAYMRRNGLVKDQNPIPLTKDSEHTKYLDGIPWAPKA